MGIRLVPLLTGLLPILAIHTTYLVSASEGYVPWCFPYIDSCTSISATGRHGSAYFIFKATMIPAVALQITYWALTCRWLKTLGDRLTPARTIMSVGIVAAIFLAIYTAALGAAGDEFRLQRRIGIIVYFAFTFLAQLLLTWRIGLLQRNEPSRAVLVAICCFLLATGLLTLLLDASIDNYAEYEDAFEWILALAIQVFFLVTWKTWKNTGFDLNRSS
jgi:Frag1/DRAM/Sfk1 family